ncbi:MAG: hypothetical protein KGI90_00045 [Burkholderiales bacterium]|nr:hypothetical protein [Burkholderiales bacterium]
MKSPVLPIAGVAMGPVPGRPGPRAALALAAFVALLPLGAWAAARITSPRAGATVHSNSGDVLVRVAGVAAGDRVRPVLDGRRLRVVYASPTFTLHGVQRGAHRVAVDVLDPRRRWLEQTPAVPFEVWHASRLMHARP